MGTRDTFIQCEQGTEVFNEHLVFFSCGAREGKVNEVIEDYYDEIANRYQEEHLQFIYMPRFLQMVGDKVLSYITGNRIINVRNHRLTARDILPEFVRGSLPETPALVVYSQKDNGFYIVQFDDDSSKESILRTFEETATAYSQHKGGPRAYTDALYELPAQLREVAEEKAALKRADDKSISDIMYSLADDTPELDLRDLNRKPANDRSARSTLSGTGYSAEKHERFYSDYHPSSDEEVNRVMADRESRQLIENMQREWQRLAAKGITEELLLRIFHSVQKPSPLHILDGHIYLSAMDDALIKMAPLDRAFYVLYLKHPEGINYKDIVDYKEELFELYCGFSARVNRRTLHKTVEHFVDPTRNDMSVSASRIKRAFLAVLTPQLAEQYYIRGEQGESKYISLDRSLVKFTTFMKQLSNEQRTFFEKLRQWFGK